MTSRVTIDYLINNPLVLIFFLMLIVGLPFYYRSVLKKDKSRDKIVNFALAIIPVRASFYNYLNKRYIIIWILLLILFGGPAIGLAYSMKDGFSSSKLFLIAVFLMFPIIAFSEARKYKSLNDENRLGFNKKRKK